MPGYYILTNTAVFRILPTSLWIEPVHPGSHPAFWSLSSSVLQVWPEQRESSWLLWKRRHSNVTERSWVAVTEMLCTSAQAWGNKLCSCHEFTHRRWSCQEMERSRMKLVISKNSLTLELLLQTCCWEGDRVVQHFPKWLQNLTGDKATWLRKEKEN